MVAHAEGLEGDPPFLLRGLEPDDELRHARGVQICARLRRDDISVEGLEVGEGCHAGRDVPGTGREAWVRLDPAAFRLLRGEDANDTERRIGIDEREPIQDRGLGTGVVEPHAGEAHGLARVPREAGALAGRRGDQRSVRTGLGVPRRQHRDDHPRPEDGGGRR